MGATWTESISRLIILVFSWRLPLHLVKPWAKHLPKCKSSVIEVAYMELRNFTYYERMSNKNDTYVLWIFTFLIGSSKNY